MTLNPGAPSAPKPRRKQPAWLAPEHQQLQAQARLQGFSGLGILVALIVAVYIALFAPKTALA